MELEKAGTNRNLQILQQPGNVIIINENRQITQIMQIATVDYLNLHKMAHLTGINGIN